MILSFQARSGYQNSISYAVSLRSSTANFSILDLCPQGYRLWPRGRFHGLSSMPVHLTILARTSFPFGFTCLLYESPREEVNNTRTIIGDSTRMSENVRNGTGHKDSSPIHQSTPGISAKIPARNTGQKPAEFHKTDQSRFSPEQRSVSNIHSIVACYLAVAR